MKTLALALILLTGSALALADEMPQEKPALHKLPDPALIEQWRPETRTPPTGFEIVNPGEFCKADGILLAWPGWGHPLIADVARAVADDYLVFMVVRDSNGETSASNYLLSQGVNMGNVLFIHDSRISSSSMWIRDYGPFHIYEDGDRAIVDFFYGTYQGDDDINETIAAFLGFPYYHTDLLHHGGNHITDGNGMGFCSTNIWEHNSGYSEAEVRGNFRDYLGIDSLVVYEPMQGDLTGHTDMFCKLLNDSLFVVGEYDEEDVCHAGDRELLNDLADYLGTLNNLQGRPFSVARVPMGPYDPDGPYCAINRTYTNSQIINDKVLVPIYGAHTDSAALAVYAEQMPGYEVIGIDSEFIIQYAGAVHCMSNLIHSSNPLIVLHRPILEAPIGTSPTVVFSINPRFGNSTASVFYKLDSEEEYTEVPASFSQGVWTAGLPQMLENFEYYISGWSMSGMNPFTVLLPENAPASAFSVEVESINALAEDFRPRLHIRPYPNPWNESLSFTASGLSSSDGLKIRIVDLTGREVWSSSFAPSASGVQNFRWRGSNANGKRVPPGTYFYRIESSDRSYSGKVIRLK